MLGNGSGLAITIIVRIAIVLRQKLMPAKSVTGTGVNFLHRRKYENFGSDDFGVGESLDGIC